MKLIENVCGYCIKAGILDLIKLTVEMSEEEKLSASRLCFKYK
jgi:hypothetical protein